MKHPSQVTTEFRLTGLLEVGEEILKRGGESFCCRDGDVQLTGER